VPTWLDELPMGSLPGGDQVGDQPGNGDGLPIPQEPGTKPDLPAEPQLEPNLEPSAPIESPLEKQRFRHARTNFSNFASSGGANSKALRRAVSDYVRSGTGGSRNAVRRMGSSRASASKALGVFRQFQREGVEDTLLQLNLRDLVGGSPQDVFLGLTEVVCNDGGPIDEAIGRDAWLETIAQIDQLGMIDMETLTGDQIREFFLSFISHAIEALLYQEIGINGFQFANSLQDIESFDLQFRSYIERAVHDSFSSDLAVISAMSDKDIKTIVDKTYQDAWALLEDLGGEE
jgi:hypothetical protein